MTQTAIEIVGVLQRLEAAIDALDLESANGDVAAAICLRDCAVERLREQVDRLDTFLVEYIPHRGEIEIGTVRYYVGPTKRTKIRDKVDCCQTLLERFGHEHVAKQFLVSEPFKHGAIAKEIEPAEWVQLFEVSYEQEVKEGKIARPRKIDTQFVK